MEEDGTPTPPPGEDVQTIPPTEEHPQHHSKATSITDDEKLLTIESEEDLEITFPAISDETHRQVLWRLNDTCNRTLEGIGVNRMDLLSALQRFADHVEGVTAPVNGTSNTAFADWLVTLNVNRYPNGIRLSMVKLKEFFLRELEKGTITERDVRKILLSYTKAVEFEQD